MQIAIIHNQPTMSSRDIAELVESRHADVCRTIERLVEKGVIVGCAPSAYTHEQNGQQYTEYHLDKRSSLIVVAQLSPEFTARIVDRWQELEGKQQSAFAIPPTYAEALRLAADQQEQLETQAKLIEQQRPAVEFLDRFVEAKSTKSLREVAKVLGVKEREFIGLLESEGVLFRQGGSLLPFAHHQHQGYFEVKTGESNGHAYHQTRFTPEGVAWVAKKFSKKEAA